MGFIRGNGAGKRKSTDSYYSAGKCLDDAILCTGLFCGVSRPESALNLPLHRGLANTPFIEWKPNQDGQVKVCFDGTFWTQDEEPILATDNTQLPVDEWDDKWLQNHQFIPRRFVVSELLCKILNSQVIWPTDLEDMHSSKYWYTQNGSATSGSFVSEMERVAEVGYTSCFAKAMNETCQFAESKNSEVFKKNQKLTDKYQTMSEEEKLAHWFRVNTAYKAYFMVELLKTIGITLTAEGDLYDALKNAASSSVSLEAKSEGFSGGFLFFKGTLDNSSSGVQTIVGVQFKNREGSQIADNHKLFAFKHIKFSTLEFIANGIDLYVKESVCVNVESQVGAPVNFRMYKYINEDSIGQTYLTALKRELVNDLAKSNVVGANSGIVDLDLSRSETDQPVIFNTIGSSQKDKDNYLHLMAVRNSYEMARSILNKVTVVEDRSSPAESDKLQCVVGGQLAIAPFTLSRILLGIRGDGTLDSLNSFLLRQSESKGKGSVNMDPIFVLQETTYSDWVFNYAMMINREEESYRGSQSSLDNDPVYRFDFRGQLSGSFESAYAFASTFQDMFDHRWISESNAQWTLSRARKEGYIADVKDGFYAIELCGKNFKDSFFQVFPSGVESPRISAKAFSSKSQSFVELLTKIGLARLSADETQFCLVLDSERWKPFFLCLKYIKDYEVGALIAELVSLPLSTRFTERHSGRGDWRYRNYYYFGIREVNGSKVQAITCDEFVTRNRDEREKGARFCVTLMNRRFHWFNSGEFDSTGEREVLLDAFGTVVKNFEDSTTVATVSRSYSDCVCECVDLDFSVDELTAEIGKKSSLEAFE